MSLPVRVVLMSEVNSKLGAPFLSILAEHPLVELVGVVTSPRGRLCPYFLGEEDQVDLDAQGRGWGIPPMRPANVNDPGSVAAIAALKPDYIIVGNYQQILKADLLGVPRITSVNFHPSPLPKYAGWAPFFWMARTGETRSGVTAIAMTTQIDGGPVIAAKPIMLSGTETALEIRESHTVANVALLRELIPRLAAGRLPLTPQDPGKRTYFSKPGDQDHWLDFTQDTETILRTVRAGYRRPGAYVLTEDGEVMVVLSMEAVGTRYPASVTPGTVRHENDDVFIAAKDGWLRLWSIEVEGEEQLGHLPRSHTSVSTRFAPRPSA
ncbi:formyltransferase family protein [Sphaerisporangium sp. NPDC005289]|uniref:methionyl-tRNA formyltransferase n=1 Tax=Sphaerisporangium sp. NPDC005289 TaxID=3155247 RepID=UPI0033A10F6B